MRMRRYFSRFIDLKMGLAGAVIMGLIVGLINADHGLIPAIIAASKQAAYTFIFGGILIRMLEYLLFSIRNRLLAVIFSVLIISSLTVVMVYAVHSLKGTPKPFLSTLPTVILAPPGFAALAVYKRKATGKVSEPVSPGRSKRQE